MAERIYLAMTAGEFAALSSLPPYIGWMACHFSPYGTGLSNLPVSLPAGSLLILNDRIPICGHDPDRIAGQLLQLCEANQCSGILLDFQRSDIPETAALTALLARSAFPCPLSVSEPYASHSPGPVFLSACPHHISLEDHIAPWQGRELWLELARDAETITLTQSGAVTHGLPFGEIPAGGFEEQKLHCHYAVETTPSVARFTLWRTRADLEELAREAAGLGIHTLVGLYQDLK